MTIPSAKGYEAIVNHLGRSTKNSLLARTNLTELRGTGILTRYLSIEARLTSALLHVHQSTAKVCSVVVVWKLTTSYVANYANDPHAFSFLPMQ